MADVIKFRSALNGFNRSDVAEYIEALCAKHQSTMQDSQDEIEILTQKLAQAQEELENQTAKTAAVEAELDQTQTALEATQKALEEALTALTEPAAAEPEETPDYPSLELEAYRRAEAMERTSAERAVRLQQQLNDMLDQVSGRYEQTGQEIQVLTEDIRINLQRLQEALSDLEAIFDETTQSFEDMDTAEPVSETE